MKVVQSSCAFVGLLALVGCVTPQRPSPQMPLPPNTHRVFEDRELGIAFAYPRSWTLGIECDYPTPGSCIVYLAPPPRPASAVGSEPTDPPGCTWDQPNRETSISVGAEPNYQAQSSACEGLIPGSPLRGSVYGVTEKVFSDCPGSAMADAAEACLSANDRHVVIHMAPPSSEFDGDLLSIVQSFRFLD